VSEEAGPAPDPSALLQTRDYRKLLVLAGVIGILVSLASWGFLELIHWLQIWVYKDLPSALGFATVPKWWPLPVLAVAAVPIAFAVGRLPGAGGHQPADGLKGGPPAQPIELPGILLASLATIGLGMVLGPEAPLIAIGAGLGILAVKLSKKDTPDQALALIAAAASFAAISSLFGSAVVGAVIIIEAAGLGGATLPIILLPGLIAAGIGSLVFIGMGSLTGLSSSAYAIAPLALPVYNTPTVAAFAWTMALSAVVAVLVFVIFQIGRQVQKLVARRPFAVVTVAALAVAVLAMTFAHITGKPDTLVLFSGQDAMDSLVGQASTLSVSSLAFLIAFKGIAYGISLGSGRGGPTFPALFLGIAAGLLCSHLPGLSETPAVAALVGAATVAALRLPLASVILALYICHGGLATSPLIIMAVVVSYLTVLTLSTRLDARSTSGSAQAVASPEITAQPSTATAEGGTVQ